MPAIKPPRSLSRLLTLVVSLGTLTGCVPAWVQQRLDDAQQQQVRLQQQVSLLEAELQDGLSLALCSPELRQLLDNVKQECGHGAGATGAATCSTAQVRGSVIRADPEHKGHFLKFMSHLPHEVLYLSKGVTELPPHRLQRLQRLARRAVLKNTVFLVVASPQLNEKDAEDRAALVEKSLLQLQVPADKLWRWLYDFQPNKAEIERKVDQPGLGEDARLQQGVWVFRADC